MNTISSFTSSVNPFFLLLRWSVWHTVFRAFGHSIRRHIRPEVGYHYNSMSKGTGCQHFAFGGDIRARMSTPSDWDGFLIPDAEALAQDFLELVGLYQKCSKGLQGYGSETRQYPKNASPCPVGWQQVRSVNIREEKCESYRKIQPLEFHGISDGTESQCWTLRALNRFL